MSDGHRRITNFGSEAGTGHADAAIPEAAGPTKRERPSLRYYRPLSRKELAPIEEGSGPEMGSIDDMTIVDAAVASFGESPLLEVVIGRDDRVRLKNDLITKAPWRQICALRISSTTGKIYVGTGWFIGPGLLATAGHCVYLHKEGGWPASIEVLPELRGSKSLPRIRATRFGSVAGWVEDQTRDFDYGVVFLDDTATGRKLGNFEVQVWDDNGLKNLSAKISGYPADRDRAEYQYFHERPIQSTTPSTILYDIDTYGGQSGSPVWCDTEEDGIVAVGIHTTGSIAGNSATRITAPVLTNLCSWLGDASGNANRIPRAAGTDPGDEARDERGAGAPPPRATKAPKATPANLAHAIEIAGKHREVLMKKPGVLDVRGGYKFVGGRITPTPAVVVAVDRKNKKVPKEAQIPPKLDDVLTDVEVADPYQRLAALGGTESAGIERPRLLIEEIQFTEAEAIPMEGVEEAAAIGYKPPKNVKLKAVSGAMTLTCHVSPDAGWATLGPFLSGAKSTITLGMYDFTAPHIYQTVRTLLRDSKTLKWHQTLDPKESLPKPEDVESNKAGDLHEKSIVNGLKRVAGARFRSEFASIGSGGTFASAYHIKVAVRDHGDFWLSSGNWQSSNQPNIDFLGTDADLKLVPRYNREWHVVVEGSAKLAKCFEAFLQHDLETAKTARVGEAVEAPKPDLLLPVDELLELERAAKKIRPFKPKTFTFTKAKPIKLQPILTPDNYVEHVLELLRDPPQEKLYFQNQSLNPIANPTPAFEEMMALLADYSNDQKLDVRMVFRNIGPIRKKLESLQAAGFNMKRVKVQAGCHTKGIIIDTERILLGSHNFTNQGVQFNRDASLLIKDKRIAAYYEEVFLHDWDQLAKLTIREEATPIPVVGMEAVALAGATDAVQVPWSFYEEE